MIEIRDCVFLRVSFVCKGSFWVRSLRKGVYGWIKWVF